MFLCLNSEMVVTLISGQCQLLDNLNILMFEKFNKNQFHTFYVNESKFFLSNTYIRK